MMEQDPQWQEMHRQWNELKRSKKEGPPGLFFEIAQRVAESLRNQLSPFKGGSIKPRSYDKHEAVLLIKSKDASQLVELHCISCLYIQSLSMWKPSNLVIEEPDKERPEGRELFIITDAASELLITCFSLQLVAHQT